MTEDDVKGLCYTLEIATLKQRVEQLTSGPGGIMEMKQTIADKEAEIADKEREIEDLRRRLNDWV
jgi:cell division protein FtsL